MPHTAKTTERSRDQIRKEKKEAERQHEKAVEDTFPASDPPSTSEPGGGITGPEVIDEKKKKD